MLVPSPERIRTLLSRYNEVQLRHSQSSTYELQRQLEDVTYTLCVSTRTRTVSDALLAADAILRQSSIADEHAAPAVAHLPSQARPAPQEPQTA
ncbi:DUF5133 domain-containing protein [Streptomyces sp. RKAG290]|uniref:DUF5133 domain-containing protein n=1 Tax=Streptomyces sp. RKAG290 TaxID=2888348 RepID=UPI002034645D|nr:DUF5133 domain-containing protein [Streptomyces sp. RKAG290]MCM2415423.1 DUF5133 domain-containing protein [Streptomyces sp. RKAG290]